jgi:hypothetical protein
MDSKKYFGMDVHKESISIAVMNGVGKLVTESVIETSQHDSAVYRRAARRFAGHVRRRATAAWLHDLLKPHVTKLVVCDPLNNDPMRDGNQSDKIDARRLAELLRCL